MSAKMNFRSFARINTTSSISGRNTRASNLGAKMSTIASFKIPKVTNEPNVSFLFGIGEIVSRAPNLPIDDGGVGRS
jgi:hypothetical protein